MKARRTRVTGFTSIRQPYELSAVIALSWPTTCMFVEPQQQELGSLICLTTLSPPRQISVGSSWTIFKPPSIDQGITGNSAGSSSKTGSHFEGTSVTPQVSHFHLTNMTSLDHEQHSMK
ncbi:hypothetical protein PR202_gb07642 [Eleusine coracana subsp. coracana]|uniref:Uncharacterized protein n=1 Tax=Eleusine coracana subsp. coracana TaxID=191504 RepID=A0AAV5ECS5_ELECO|nr:hypothetical protein PR202_gb07642 [Eleusine coracana subsp. coracana]